VKDFVSNLIWSKQLPAGARNAVIALLWRVFYAVS